MKLVWWQAIREWRDISRVDPPRYAVIAVAGVLMGFASSDGRDCRPGLATVVQQTGVSEKTVLLALHWLLDHGWIVVQEAVSRRPVIYRLTIPAEALKHLPTGEVESSPDAPYPTTVGYEGEVVPNDGRVRDRSLPPLVPPLVPNPGVDDSELRIFDEEEESASARSPSGRLAALQSQNPTAPVVEDWMREVQATLRDFTEYRIDPSRMVAELASAKACKDWTPTQFAIEAIELFKAEPPKDATALFAHHLRTRITETCEPSLRVVYAGVWDRLIEIGDALLDPLFDELGAVDLFPVDITDDLLPKAMAKAEALFWQHQPER
jgi:hypothetical protein